MDKSQKRPEITGPDRSLGLHISSMRKKETTIIALQVVTILR